MEQQEKLTALLKEMQENMDSREGGRHEREDNKQKRGSKQVKYVNNHLKNLIHRCFLEGVVSKT